MCELVRIRSSWVEAGVRWLLGGIFLYAGITKAIAPLAFADNIAAFQILPSNLISLFALGLPIFEILCSILLLIGWKKDVAVLGIILMSGMFLIALGFAAIRGISVDCGCFGSGSHFGIRVVIVRDVLILFAAVCLYFPKESPATA